MPVEHERLTLLLAHADQGVAQPTVTAECDILIEQRTYELDAFVELLFLAELVADLDLEPTGLREWLAGLDAPAAPAPQDPGRPIPRGRRGQIGSRLPPSFVERASAMAS